MATSALLGTNAVIKYDPGTGTVTHQLALPLFVERAGFVQFRRAVDSMDYANREITTSGTAKELFQFTLRLDNEPDKVRDMILAAANGAGLDYYPDNTGAPSTFYTFTLMSPVGEELVILPDRDRFISHGEYEITCKVRSTDDLSPLL